MWCNIEAEAAGEIWHWSLSGVKGLRCFSVFSFPPSHQGRSHMQLCCALKRPIRYIYLLNTWYFYCSATFMGSSFCRLPGRACGDVREGMLRNWQPSLLHGSLCAVAWLAQWSAKASGGRSPWRRGNHERGVWATGGSWVYRTSRYNFGDKILARKSHSIKKEDFSLTFCCFSFQKGDIEQAIHLTKRLAILGKSNRSLRASALALISRIVLYVRENYNISLTCVNTGCESC